MIRFILYFVFFCCGITYSNDSCYGFRDICFGTDKENALILLNNIPFATNMKQFFALNKKPTQIPKGPNIYTARNAFIVNGYNLGDKDISVVLIFNHSNIFYNVLLNGKSYKENDEMFLNGDVDFLTDVFTIKYGKSDTTFLRYAGQKYWEYKKWILNDTVTATIGIKKDSGVFSAFGSIICNTLKDTIDIISPEAKKAAKMF